MIPSWDSLLDYSEERHGRMLDVTQIDNREVEAEAEAKKQPLRNGGSCYTDPDSETAFGSLVFIT